MPSTMETTAMRNITPIVTPSSVKKLLSLCARIWVSARRMASKKGMGPIRDAGEAGARRRRSGPYVAALMLFLDPLFVAQRFHGVESRRASRGHHAEENSRHGAADKRGKDGWRRHRGGDRRELPHQRRHACATHEADHRADRCQGRRFHEKLLENGPFGCAQRLAHTNLARA